MGSGVVQEIPINTILTNHLMITYLLCHVYTFMKEDAQFSPNFIWVRELALDKLPNYKENFTICILRICCIYHHEFYTYFLNRCDVLSLFKRKLLKEIDIDLRAEIDSIKKEKCQRDTWESLCKFTLPQLFGIIRNSLVKFKILSSLKETSKHKRLQIVERIVD